MNFYKLINQDGFVGIGTSLDFRKFQHKHKIILATTENEGQYIQYKDDLYHDNWMAPISTATVPYSLVNVIAIGKEEYDALYNAIESGEEIDISQDETAELEEPAEDEYVDENLEITLDYVKTMKVKEMSNTCNKVITNGFDVRLEDGNTYHFSLTTQDQLNLITLSSTVASGETQIPYHADGELCKFYSARDILTIVETATQFKTYQISYYNALKAYIESMDDMSEVSAITYGMDIPEDYQSDVLKVLNAGRLYETENR